MNDLSSRLFDLARNLATEQQWYDEARSLWKDTLASGPSDGSRKADTLVKRGAALRQERAEELRNLDAPQDAKGELLKLALKLETSAEPVHSTLCELAGRKEPDGPLDGNRFRFDGIVHKMTPTTWKLLSATWGREQWIAYDVEEDVWGVVGGSQLKSATNKLKAFLQEIGYPSYLSKAARSDFLVWKHF